MTTQLTPTQHAILAHAIQHRDGKIDWFPDKLNGGARNKVLDGLFKRTLITSSGTDWFVAAEGYDALGVARPAPTTAPEDAPDSRVADLALEADVAACEAEWAGKTTPIQPRGRTNSKLAEVLRMLQRPEGATIQQIIDATGWQAKTVRGTFAGTLKKKLGLTNK
jgi:hypothetical protein